MDKIANYEFCKTGCMAERRHTITLEYIEEIGYIAFLNEKGYTPLVFDNGYLLFFPIAALPEGIKSKDKIELTIRRIQNE